jgi:very-short-patch-repair endonuclease
VGDHHHHVTAISQDSREAAIRALAGRQSGNVSRAQLLGVGLSEGAIDARLRSGALTRRYPGVYALAPARQDPQALIAAAVLAGGPHAVASHASAAWLWGFLPRYEPTPEITITQGDRRPRHILTHRCPSLQPRDITHQRGIPSTSPARTALDLAPRLTGKQRRRMVNDGRLNGYLRLDALQDVLDRNRYHPGTKLLTSFADSNRRNPTRSPFEDDFLAFIANHGLPTPQINVRLNGREVDAFFPEANLIVECDGWEFHKDQDAFRDDRERDAENLKHGLTTMRLTKDRLELTPGYEAERLMEIYSRCVS